MTIKMGHYILKDLGAVHSSKFISECQYLCILVIVYQFLLNRFGFQNKTSDAVSVKKTCALCSNLKAAEQC
ncbi:hypothetical protein T12_12387 [Trichinella patagoniensis]|uniref:Uncharacterized protein n=1 Tax=Trichinella patagoniensis TaxID=990121 RepID=A0A0V1A7D8_9BILA|nr:hypothetical protein T12_12387 [Trichinella patagoniensis]